MIEEGVICKFADQEKPAGFWILKTGYSGPFVVHSIKLAMKNRPKWLTRFAMKHVFDIEWEDAHE